MRNVGVDAKVTNSRSTGTLCRLHFRWRQRFESLVAGSQASLDEDNRSILKEALN